MSRNYGALARDCNLSSSIFVKNITSSEWNKEIILGLRCGRLYALSIGEEYDDTGCPNFTVREGDDLGWLGYFIGNSATLERLHINDMPGDVDQIDDFVRGLNRNRSIQDLYINTSDLDLGNAILADLGEFLRNNKSLYELAIRYFQIGRENTSKLASALCDTSLKSLEFSENQFSKEGFTEIITAASTRSQIEALCVVSNHVGRIGCAAMGTLLGSRTFHLKTLDLRFNGLDDESLQLLAAGLANTTLQKLSLTGNQSITADGLIRSVIPFLQSGSCSLREFYFYSNNIGDAGAAALAHGLAKNKSLTHLWFDPTDCGISSNGWQSFVTLLCDTSSINNTYLSNHTLELIGESCNSGSPTDQVHDRVRHLLRMRTHATRKEVAIRKIFLGHRDLDMEPFFEWELKFLPLIVSWFKKSHSYDVVPTTNIQWRKLSAVYKFIRGMPLLVVHGFQTPCRRCGRKRRFIET